MKLRIPVDISIHDSKAFLSELLRFDGPSKHSCAVVMSSIFDDLLKNLSQI